MGSAVGLIACLNAVSKGFVTPEQTKIYNFGQPRVGNAEFSAFAEAHVSEIYRLVHDHDLWTHVPFCVPNLLPGRKFLHCKTEGNFFYYPYHEGTEVLYDQGMKSYQVCDGSEDQACSNSFWRFSLQDH